MIVLPVGLFLALLLSTSRIFTFLALLPLAYIVISLAPYYATPVVITTAHSATLTIAVSGWWLLFTRIKKFSRVAKFTP